MPTKNVILITVDCLRANYVGCISEWAKQRELTPCLDALAAENTLVFRQAIAQGSMTGFSFPSMLSSTYPSDYEGCAGPISRDRRLVAERAWNFYGCFPFNTAIDGVLGLSSRIRHF